jgi:hypothetical protein
MDCQLHHIHIQEIDFEAHMQETVKDHQEIVQKIKYSPFIPRLKKIWQLMRNNNIKVFDAITIDQTPEISCIFHGENYDEYHVPSNPNGKNEEVVRKIESSPFIPLVMDMQQLMKDNDIRVFKTLTTHWSQNYNCIFYDGNGNPYCFTWNSNDDDE